MIITAPKKKEAANEKLLRLAQEMPLKELQPEYNERDGRILTMVKRSRWAAIYRLHRGSTTYGYEVFEIRENPARVLFDHACARQEVYPYNEAFGRWAKSCCTLERAEYWFDEFERNVKQRKERASVKK